MTRGRRRELCFEAGPVRGAETSAWARNWQEACPARPARLRACPARVGSAGYPDGCPAGRSPAPDDDDHRSVLSGRARAVHEASALVTSIRNFATSAEGGARRHENLQLHRPEWPEFVERNMLALLRLLREGRGDFDRFACHADAMLDGYAVGLERGRAGSGSTSTTAGSAPGAGVGRLSAQVMARPFWSPSGTSSTAPTAIVCASTAKGRHLHHAGSAHSPCR